MTSSEPVAASSRMTRSAPGSSRSEIRMTRPRPWSWAAAWRRRDEVAGTLGRRDPGQVAEQPEDAPGPAQAVPAAGDPAAQDGQLDPVLGGQADVAQGSRGPLGEQELVRPAGRHRRAGIDDQADGDVLLLDEQLHEQLLEAGIDVPVELAQVVAQDVVAVVRELDRTASLDAPPAALEAAPDGLVEEQLEALELAQERLVEDGRVELGRQQVRPSLRTRRPRAGGRAGRRGRFHPEAGRPAAGEPTRPSARRRRRGSRG